MPMTQQATGGFHVRLAETKADLEAAQRLRYDVFVSELGGGGLPWSVTMALGEMWNGANLGFSLCTLLNQGSVEAHTLGFAVVVGSVALAKIYLS